MVSGRLADKADKAGRTDMTARQLPDGHGHTPLGVSGLSGCPVPPAGPSPCRRIAANTGNSREPRTVIGFRLAK